MSPDTSRKFPLRLRRLLLAGFGALLLSSFSIADLSAQGQGRSNKGGEVRGKDRASQVQELNSSAKEEKDAAKEAKKAEKAERKASKGKKGKRGKKGKKNKNK